MLYAEFGHDKRPLEHLVIQAFLVGVGFSLLFSGLFSFDSRLWIRLPSHTYDVGRACAFLAAMRRMALSPLFTSFWSPALGRSAPRPLLSKTHLEPQGGPDCRTGWRRETLIRREPHRALLRALDAFLYPGFQALSFLLILFDTLLQRCFFSLLGLETIYILGGVEAFCGWIFICLGVRG